MGLLHSKLKNPTAEFVVIEHKGRLYPAVTSAAYAVRYCPVWGRELKPTAPLRLYEELENLAEQVAFFSSCGLNTALDSLLTAAAQLVTTITTVQVNTRAGFGGAIDPQFDDEYQHAVDSLDSAIYGLVITARQELGIPAIWQPVQHHAENLRRTYVAPKSRR